MTTEHEHACDCPTPGFASLGIAPKLLDILAKHNYTVPTPIQHMAIPAAIDGQDVIGIAQTGTGKTLAFGIPMIQRLARFKGKGLVVLPTRELALQVEENLHKLGGTLGLRTVVLIGGASMVPQIKQLRADPHVIVCTPGRLLDHMEQRTVDLSGVSILVLDEADRMLDMGFAPQIKRILKAVPRERQTMLFSATMPDDIVRIATHEMKTPVRIEVAPQGTATELVEQELFVVRKDQKNRLLEAILNQYHGSVLVFTRTRFAARRIAKQLVRIGLSASDIHSDRTLSQRREALAGFKSGKYRVLVATDIASRGIDVTGIELVLNYDIPEQADDYVHRIGRTGRAGAKGRAISFATPDQGSEIEQIERYARVRLPISSLPELPPDRAQVAGDRDEREDRGMRGSRSGGQRGGGQRGGGRSSFGGGQRGGSGGQSRQEQRPPAHQSYQAVPQTRQNQPAKAAPAQAEGSPRSTQQSKFQTQRPSQNGGAHRGGGRDQRAGRDQRGGGQQGGQKPGPKGLSDDLIGLSLWPDTPNLHGGLNRKPLDPKKR